MVDSLLSKKLSKKFDTLAKKKAHFQEKEENLCKAFLAETSPETIYCVLDMLRNSAHPTHQDTAEKLRNKYENETLSFDDIMTLKELYKMNCRNIINKGDQYE